MAEISVIIPAYNQVQYVAEVLQSVLDQTFGNFELVVVDDGSTDGTTDVLARCEDPRLQVVHQANAGLSAARNTGIQHTSAPFVTFLDSDDLFERNKLAVLMDYLAACPHVGLVCGGTIPIDADGAVLGRTSGVPDPSALELPGLLMGNPVSVSAVLLRRTWLDCVGWFDEALRACEDWDLWLRVAAAGCRLAWVDDAVLRYRVHREQMTRDAGRMRTAMLTVLGKFFAQPHLPAQWALWQDSAYAAALVRAAARAYLSRDYEAAQRDLVAAVLREPTWAADGYAALVGHLVSWARTPGMDDAQAVAYLCAVRRHLPSTLADMHRPLHQAIAAMLLAPVFEGRISSRAESRRTILRALRYDPRWLSNRGVLRTMVGSRTALPMKVQA